LTSKNPMERYWGTMVCTAFGQKAAELTEEVQPLLKDDSNPVRIRAAEFLGLIGAINHQPTLIDIVNTTDHEVEGVEALNTIVWFKDFFDGKYPVKRSDFHPKQGGGKVADRLNYINGTPYPPKKGRGKKRKKTS
jgi:HEAT repeat protein